MRILIIRVGNIGDVILATPFLRKVKAAFPGCTLDLVTSPQAEFVVRHHPSVDHLYVYKKDRHFSQKIRALMLTHHLWMQNYDIVFTLEINPKYQQFAQRVVGSRGLKVGFINNGEEFVDRPGYYSFEGHVIDNYFSLLRDHFGVKTSEEDYRLDFILPANADDLVEPAFRRDVEGLGKFFIVHPGCSDYYPYRGWNPEKFAAAIRFLNDHGWKTVVTGSDADRPLIAAIAEAASLPEAIFTAVGRNFYELALLARKADGALCVDTGLLHFVRAFDVPVVGLFGPSNPLNTGCIGPGTYRMIRNDFRCGPCNFHHEYRMEDKKNCMDGRIPECMNSITVDQVTAAIHEVLLPKTQSVP